MAENNNKPQVRVASIEVELGMSVQNKAGIWCKPTARMVLTVDGGTSPAQRAAIIKQGFDEVCDNIEKPESEPEKEYTLEEAAAELGISRRTLGRKIDAGEIQTEKREYQQILIKERSIVTESALEAYRKSLEVE